jgi:hypothetical protein
LVKGNGDGCDTCGHGETYAEHNVKVIDLETRVVLESCDDYESILTSADEKKIKEAKKGA